MTPGPGPGPGPGPSSRPFRDASATDPDRARNTKLLVTAALVGIGVTALVAQRVGIAWSDTFVLVGSSVGAALACWLVGVVIIEPACARWLSTRNDVRVRAVVVALTPALSLMVGVLVAARAMFVSEHDLGALAVVICGAGVIGVVAALRLAEELDHRRQLVELSQSRSEALERSRRELVAWVSHDLRTPMAGISVMAEALIDGVVSDPEDVANYHRRIQSETVRLSRLVDDLFELSRLQVDRVSLAVERISLGDLVSDAVASATAAAEAKGVVLSGESLGAAPELDVSSPEMLRVLHNLIDNAIRHTPTGGRVSVEVERVDDHAELSVQDACGGIADDEIRRVFELAYRGDPERSPARGGGGLGLAIARGFVEAHHGEISVSNAAGGCRFTVRLPMPEA